MTARFLLPALIAGALLAGCATFAHIEAGLTDLMGKPVEDAFARLGYPTMKQEFGDDTVYTWRTDQTGAMVLPQTTSTYGTVGLTPYSGTSYSTQLVPVRHTCEVRVATGPDGIVKHWDYSGNIGGCERFAARLRPETPSE